MNTLAGMKSKKKASVSKLKVGTYKSTIVSVKFDEDYVDETMIIVKYKLLDENGETRNFTERFLNDLDNDRSKQFDDYLKANGVNDIFDAVGFTERVTLKKSLKGGKIYLNIVERNPGSDEVDSDEA